MAFGASVCANNDVATGHGFASEEAPVSTPVSTSWDQWVTSLDTAKLACPGAPSSMTPRLRACRPVGLQRGTHPPAVCAARPTAGRVCGHAGRCADRLVHGARRRAPGRSGRRVRPDERHLRERDRRLWALGRRRAHAGRPIPDGRPRRHRGRHPDGPARVAGVARLRSPPPAAVRPAGDLGIYAVGPDGTLTRTGTVYGLPAFDGSNGMEGIVAT